MSSTDNHLNTDFPDAGNLVIGTSLWQDAVRRLKKNRMAVAGGWLFAFSCVAFIAGPIIIKATWGYTYSSSNLAYGPNPPSLHHWFGTDYFGRDLLTRVLYGGRVSLTVGFLAAIVSAIVGLAYGAISGYVGGRVDAMMMRIVDILYALPYMFLVILLMTLLGRELWLVFIALGMVGWLTTARIVRGQVLSLKQQEFVKAARSIGTKDHMIIWRHLLPNALGPVLVYFTLTVPSMILQEAFLSFLGLGVQAPRPSLGALINDGANQMIVFWWTLVFPATWMATLLFSLNFIGDGLRDALDPKMRAR